MEVIAAYGIISRYGDDLGKVWEDSALYKEKMDAAKEAIKKEFPDAQITEARTIYKTK